MNNDALVASAIIITMTQNTTKLKLVQWNRNTCCCCYYYYTPSSTTTTMSMERKLFFGVSRRKFRGNTDWNCVPLLFKFLLNSTGNTKCDKNSLQRFFFPLSGILLCVVCCYKPFCIVGLHCKREMKWMVGFDSSPHARTALEKGAAAPAPILSLSLSPCVGIVECPF